jgi:hypothetical protein
MNKKIYIIILFLLLSAIAVISINSVNYAYVPKKQTPGFNTEDIDNMSIVNITNSMVKMLDEKSDFNFKKYILSEFSNRNPNAVVHSLGIGNDEACVYVIIRYSEPDVLITQECLFILKDTK